MLLALEGLRANKLRSLLTILGIIIGIGSVIGIVTIGDSMSATVAKGLQGIGATNVNVSLIEREIDGMYMTHGEKMDERDMITDEMLEKYSERYAESIEAISLSTVGNNGKAQDGRRYANITEMGVNVGFAKANHLKIVNGRFLRDSDLLSRRGSAVVSDRLVGNLFHGGQDPLGKEIRISVGDDIDMFTIVGVYQYDPKAGAIMSGGGAGAGKHDVRTELYIPLTTFNTLKNKPGGHTGITVMGATSADPKELATKTGKFFSKLYESNKRYTVEAVSMESMIADMSSMTKSVSVSVSIIAGISLLVGGIGVMNIMLVSVTERTREIGTRKALGARNAAIRAQFIVESIIICVIGGIIGVILGILIGIAGASMFGYKASPSPVVILGSVLFSMAIGVFFGYYPAKKASSLDPIEALRYE
jgi:putative ABC transport system permease protein